MDGSETEERQQRQRRESEKRKREEKEKREEKATCSLYMSLPSLRMKWMEAKQKRDSRDREEKERRESEKRKREEKARRERDLLVVHVLAVVEDEVDPLGHVAGRGTD